MATPSPTDSILIVDVGNVHTRAAFLDIVGGEYRFIASGKARTTIEQPFNDMGEGVRQAFDEIRLVTGRPFIDDEAKFIIPSRPDGSGADHLVATSTAGEALRVALVGLMPNVSLTTAQKVAGANYMKVVEIFSLGDRRREDEQIDSFLKAKPDIVLIAGGTEHGSKSAVLRLADTVAMAVHLMPERHRPEILFAGNREIRPAIKKKFEGLCEVTEAENVRPELDLENIDSARRQMSTLYEHVRIGRIPGYSELSRWSGSVLPTAQAQGFVVNYLNRVVRSENGSVGVDIGSATTSIAACFRGRMALMCRPDIGVGHHATAVIGGNTLERVMRWLPHEFPEEVVRDYIYNKSLVPHTVPQELDELYLEHAVARECLQITLGSALHIYPETARTPGPGLTPYFDNILLNGAVLAQAPQFGQAALIMLDGLQPNGVSTILLDVHSLAPALGIASAINASAAVQVLESGSFQNLGTVVSLTGEGKIGQPAVKVKIEMPSGEKIEEKINCGALRIFPLEAEAQAKVTIQPTGNFDAGFGAGTSKTLTLKGGAVGLIIDARGRPIQFPRKPEERYALVNEWCQTLGQYLPSAGDESES